MRYPEFLPEGGTIGMIAPAFGCRREPYHTAFQSAQASLQEMGYEIRRGPNCYKDKGIGISNTPEACAKEFMRFYTSRKNDILLSCGGGEEMCEILPFLDFKRLAGAKPKWFMGYSDNTNISFLLTTLCDTASLYGPNAPAFGMEPWHPSLTDAMNLITGQSLRVKGYDLFEGESLKDEEHPLEPYHTTEPAERVCWPGEEAHFSGRLVGGCLDCLANLVGTRFDGVKAFTEKYASDGIIWYLEACDLNVFGIRRACWQLREAGWFEHAAGFLIGRPYNGEDMFGLNRFQAVTDILGPLQVPILMDLDIGHIPPMMPLISGSLAEVNFSDNEIEIEMKLR